jgi:plasmid stabilization system protein ParE
MRLEEIHDYVAGDDAGAAERLVDKILRRGDSLANFAGRGKRLPEAPRGPFREVLEGRYRIVYPMRGEVVQIMSVVQARRRIQKEDLG